MSVARRLMGLFLALACMGAWPAGSLCANRRHQPAGRYWVYFTDKPDNAFDPWDFFDPRAIERRLRHRQNLYDPVDFPVSTAYIEGVRPLVDTLDVVSRWLNAVHVVCVHDAATALTRLPFVDRVEPAGRLLLPASVDPGPETEDSGLPGRRQLEALADQIGALQGGSFISKGYDGKGVRIAVLDAGFPGVDTHPAFRHLREENRIVATWDFHRDRPDVYRYNPHGTMVLSLIAGMAGEQVMGLATGAEFLLARTETWREPLVEEKYWLAAAEWADRLGADIINSSLGYSYHRYFPEQMDGHSSPVALAARIATRKGILVVSSAGNQGDSGHWRTIVTPADVDSVLTIGAVDLPAMLRTPYSSPGPNAIGQLKPNLVAPGDVVLAGARGYTANRGTSFATPLVTGFAACLLEMFPFFTNMQLFRGLQRSGSLYPYFDYSHGYGLPQAGVYFNPSTNMGSPTVDMEEQEGQLVVTLRYNPMHTVNGEERSPERSLYYHVRNPDGTLERYYVLRAEQPEVLRIDMHEFAPGQQLFVHFEGYTVSWTF